jgi:NADH:ubiquinone oxidoreductase subunit 6 (subunit J)
MLSEIVFFISAVAAFVAAVVMFKAREMSHAMVGFLFITLSAAAVLAVLGLPLLALLQLFIMVGGVSTYLFVGVSAENLSRFRHTSLPVLVVGAIALAAIPIYRISFLQGLGGESNSLTGSLLTASVGSNMALFYMLAVLLFGIGIGSIIMMKSLRAGRRR